MEWIQWNGVALQLVNNQAALSQEHAHPPLLLVLLPRRWKEARNEEGEEEGLTRLEEIRRAQLQPLLSVIALSCSILTTVTLTSRVCARSQCKAMQQVVRNLPPRRRAAAPPALSSRRHLLRLRCYCTMHAMPYFPPYS